MSETTCSSCGAPIEWVLTVNGKRMPMDPPKPCPACKGKGEFAASVGYEPRPGAEPLRVNKIPGGPCGRCKATGIVVETHFATCPNANQHRRKQEPKPGRSQKR